MWLTAGFKSSSTKNWSGNSRWAHSWAAREGTINLPKRIFLATQTRTTHDTPVTMIATVLVIVLISRCPLGLCHPTPEGLSQKCSLNVISRPGAEEQPERAYTATLWLQKELGAQRKEPKEQKTPFLLCKQSMFLWSHEIPKNCENWAQSWYVPVSDYKTSHLWYCANIQLKMNKTLRQCNISKQQPLEHDSKHKRSCWISSF